MKTQQTGTWNVREWHVGPAACFKCAILTIGVLGLRLFPEAARSQPIVATWEHQNSAAPGGAEPLSYGAKVNPDPNSMLRIRVTGLQDNFWVTNVEIWAHRDGPDFIPLFSDKRLKTLGSTDSLLNRRIKPVDPDGPPLGGGDGNSYNTAWFPPPKDPSIAQDIKSILPSVIAETELYAKVYGSNQVSASAFQAWGPVKTDDHIDVMDRVVHADIQVEKGKSDAGLEASAGMSLPGVATGKVGGSASGSRETEKVSTGVYYDPAVTVALVLSEPLPMGWTLSLDPQSFTLGAGQTQSVNLVYTTPSTGIASYYLDVTTSDPTNGATSLLLGPMMFVLESSNAPPLHLASIDLGQVEFKLLYSTTSSNAQVTAVNLDQTNNQVKFDLAAQGAGTLRVLLPNGLLGEPQHLAFAVNGVPVAPALTGLDSVCAMLEIPYNALSTNVTVRQTGVVLHARLTASGQIGLSWPLLPAALVLQSAPSVDGPWQPVVSTNAVSSPYYLAPTGPAAFFRLH